MNADIRVETAFPHHQKTIKLRAALGPGAVWGLVQLWAWTATVRPNGDLSGYTDAELEHWAGWDGPAGTLLPALAEVGFVDGRPSRRKIHQWKTHQPHVSKAPTRIEKARKAAQSRWNPDARAKPEHMPPSRPVPSLSGVSSGASSGPPEVSCLRTDTPSPAAANGGGFALSPPTSGNGNKPLAWWLSAFAQFWTAYPTRNGKRPGKQAALKAWLVRCPKTQPEAVAKLGKILGHLESHKVDLWADLDEERFIPHASTWLSDEVPR